MNPYEAQLTAAREEAEAILAKTTKSADDVRRMGELSKAIADLAARVKSDKETRAALAEVAGPAPTSETLPSDWTKTGADLAPFRFAAKDVEALRDAAKSGMPFGIQAKAVQAESDFDIASGATFDLTRYPAVRSRFRVSSLIPAKASLGDGASVTYYRPTTLATAGAAVAEGGTLAQSSPTFTAITETIRKMGHYAFVPGEALQDQADFMSVMATELIEGLIAVENAQVLVGAGTGANLSGIFDTAHRTNVQTRSQGTDTAIDAIIKALDDVRSNAFVEPDAIIMRSADWTALRLSKDANDGYYFGPGGNPVGGGARSIDGVPVHVTEDGTAGVVYVGAFSTARLYVRQAPRAEATISDGTDFLTDAVKMRVLERVALATPVEKAFCALTLA